jgi:hypothetical protein
MKYCLLVALGTYFLVSLCVLIHAPELLLCIMSTAWLYQGGGIGGQETKENTQRWHVRYDFLKLTFSVIIYCAIYNSHMVPEEYCLLYIVSLAVTSVK